MSVIFFHIITGRAMVGKETSSWSYDNLTIEFNLEDIPSFANFVRMAPEDFKKILKRIAPRKTKEDTNFRKALSRPCPKASEWHATPSPFLCQGCAEHPLTISPNHSN